MITSIQDSIYFMRWLLLDDKASVRSALSVDPQEIKETALAVQTEPANALAKVNHWLNSLSAPDGKTAKTYIRVHRKRAKLAADKAPTPVSISKKNYTQLRALAMQLKPELLEPDINAAIDYLLGNTLQIRHYRNWTATALETT